MDSSLDNVNVTANIDVCELSSNHKFEQSIDVSESLSMSIESSKKLMPQQLSAQLKLLPPQSTLPPLI